MTATILPGERSGSVTAPASKSQAHRLLICGALGEKPVTLRCDGVSRDIAATAACLNALGAEIAVENGVIRVAPIREVPEGLCRLPCGESGSTLRFLLPVAGALGAETVFLREGRLPERPLAPLDRELTDHGMTIRAEGAALYCSGQLRSGEYTLPGDVSSQFVSGLLMALPRLEGNSALTVTGKLESAAYVTMTEDALIRSGVFFARADQLYGIPGGQKLSLPEELTVEGDWSGAAFFLCMGALSSRGVTVRGLGLISSQGDRAVLDILRTMGAEITLPGDGVHVRRGELRGCVIDASPVPDLIPALCAVAAAAAGETRIVNAARLRLKESDRIKSTAEMIRALGGEAEELPDGLVIRGKAVLRGGTVDPRGDHRIAMAAAVAAGVCRESVVIPGSECAAKSYPRFWEDLDTLKGARA